MTAPLVLVLLIAASLPAVGWWLAGQPIRPPHRWSDQHGSWETLFTRHGLSAAEVAHVAAVLPRGRRPADDRLARAAADWARELLARQDALLPQRRRTRRWVLVLGGCWAVAVLVRAVYRVVTVGPAEVDWISVGLWAAVAVWFVRRRRALRRTIELVDAPMPPDAG